MLSSRLLTAILCVAWLVSAVVFLAEAKAPRYPGDNQGYAPAQPIAFSHRLHAGTLEISCFYCHAGAERSRQAGVPAVETCLNCHRYVIGSAGQKSAELQKLYEYAGLGPDMRPKPGGSSKTLAWVKVHDLPAFAHFDHASHVLEGVSCQTCHGPVETMDRIVQAKSLMMGMCIQCHRQVNLDGINGHKVHAPLDCSGCHY
jgi:hypothetical protein